MREFVSEFIFHPRVFYCSQPQKDFRWFLSLTPRLQNIIELSLTINEPVKTINNQYKAADKQSECECLPHFAVLCGTLTSSHPVLEYLCVWYIVMYFGSSCTPEYFKLLLILCGIVGGCGTFCGICGNLCGTYSVILYTLQWFLLHCGTFHLSSTLLCPLLFLFYSWYCSTCVSLNCHSSFW